MGLFKRKKKIKIKDPNATSDEKDDMR